MSRALCLTYYDVLRITRHRKTLLFILAVPLAAAVLRAMFPGWSFTAKCAWACPFICALLTFTVLHVQRTVDRASGLRAGIISSPISRPLLTASRAGACLFIFGVQMAVFAIILALRF